MFDRSVSALRARPWLFAAVLSAVLLTANVIAEPAFGAPSNWPQLLASLAPLVLVAFAATPATVSGGGGLDLSVGPLAVLVNVVLVEVLLRHGITSIWACVPILLGLGLGVGLLNGFLVAYARYVPVIATLCTFFVIAGINTKLGQPPHDAGANWTGNLGDQVLGFIPGGLVMIAIPALIWFGLSRTSFHRSLYATGGNDVTAFSSGVNVQQTRLIAYGIGGLFAAFGGIALTALVQTSSAQATSLYILIGITGVALGGTPLFGGRGGLTGSFFGASVLFLTQSIISSLSISPTWLNVVYGVMLMLGVLVGAAVLLRQPRQVGVRR